MANNQSQTNTEKVGNFLTRNKFVFLVAACVIVVGIIGYTVFDKVSSKNIAATLDVIEKAEFSLLKDSTGLTEEELAPKYESTLSSIEKYTSKGGVIGARSNYLKAEINFRQNKFDVARDSYILAANKAKGTYLYSICYYNAAVSCAELKDNAKAIEYFEIAANDKDFADPTHALFSIGMLKEELLDYVGAKESYEKITAKDNTSDPWSNLAKSRLLSMQIEGKI